MARWNVLRAAAPVALALCMVGCSNQKSERITMLEQSNRNLTGQLNRAQQEINGCYRDRDTLDQRLALAAADVADLQRRLDQMPPPVTVAPGWTAIPGGAMIAIEGSVLFASGKVKLKTEAGRTLGGVVSAINGEYGDKEILVFGHTDATPIRKSGWKDNWQLSTERALAVVRHLQSQGVAPSRLAACGAGQYRPRATGNDKAARVKNRRVEIFAVNPQ